MTTAIVDNLSGRYVPVDVAEYGGFSGVVKCNDQHLDRYVATKFIKDRIEVDRIKDEIAALLKMRSKNVVQVYDLISTGEDELGIVLEFVDGSDLLDSSSHPTDKDDLLRVLWQVASGLSDIHDAGLIHRDIKPNNIKVDPEGVVKIFDFGLSRETGEEAKTLGFKGTIGFAAPELYSNEVVEFTQAIDVYAYGATALYLATGDIPKLLRQVPPRLAPDDVFNGTLLQGHGELIDLFKSCFSRNPEQRPSISKIRDALSKHLLFNKHQALAVSNAKTHTLDMHNRSAALSLGNIGSFNITYDGFDFRLQNVVGEVSVNDTRALSGMAIPGSCVVAIGDQNRHNWERTYITFDVSNPEVAL
ncbi:serine/threonine-protein kinase [Ferrimonas pelagia]|uniref:Serine/threonine-protein kinase n=1 Tax=Ferrimonas pelagia TaxID=1177826 RepID=A0ABP9EZ04_9GAMM